MYICAPFFYINSVICIYIYIYIYVYICILCYMLYMHICTYTYTYIRVSSGTWKHWIESSETYLSVILIFYSEVETQDRTYQIFYSQLLLLFMLLIITCQEIPMQKLYFMLMIDTLYIIYMLYMTYITYICITNLCCILIIYFLIYYNNI